MVDASVGGDPERAADGNGKGHANADATDRDSFSELRSLLVGPERRELMALRAHLQDPSIQTRDVSRVLPDAIALRPSDPHLPPPLPPSPESPLTPPLPP